MRGLFWFTFGVVLVAKVMLAIGLPLHGDEAFYWQESRALAPGYSDVPLATPWLIRLGTTLAGTSALGVRWPFVLLGAMLPLLVVALARRVTTSGPAAWAAGLLALCVPLGALCGVLAVPDVPLTVAILLATLALERCARDAAAPQSRRAFAGVPAWTALGAAIALGWLSHYRIVILYVAGALFVLGTASGRALLKRPGFWAAQALGALGVVPALLFNASTGWSALRFQYVDRHPWSFQGEALREPLVQALVTTPLLFAIAVAALVLAWRRRAASPAHAVLAATGLGVLGGFLLIGLFADVERSRFHWPLPAFLVAMPLVPELLARLWRRGVAARALAILAPALGVATGVALFLLLHALTKPSQVVQPAWITENISGWHEVGGHADALRRRIGAGRVVVADNFLLGAELDFAFGGHVPVYVLDHPLNAKHGRATQLAVLGRDERALRARPENDLLVFVQESSRRPIDRLAGYTTLCERFARVEQAAEFKVGNSPFVAFRASRAGAPLCDVPAFGYVDVPLPDAVIGTEDAAVAGWAIKERVGVARVELLVDGKPNGQATYGTPAAKVKQQWPSSTDPGHPNVGFTGTLALAGLRPGRHTLALRVVDRDGHARFVAEQQFEYRPPGT